MGQDSDYGLVPATATQGTTDDSYGLAPVPSNASDLKKDAAGNLVDPQSGQIVSRPAEPSWPVKPLPGESYQDTVNRAIDQWKGMTTEQKQAAVQNETKGAAVRVPETLGTAALAGPAIIASTALAPDLAASAVPSEIAGSPLLGSVAQGMAAGATGGAATTALAEPVTGTNPLSSVGVKDIVKSAGLGALTGLFTGAAPPSWQRAAQWLGLSNDEAAALAPAAGKFQPALNVSSTDVQKYAGDNGIDLTPFQATKQQAAGEIQAVGERSIFGGRGLKEAQEANAQKFIQSLGDFANDADPHLLGDTPEKAGQSIKQAVQTAKDIAHDNATAAYKGLPSVQVDQSGIAKTWNDVRGELPLGAEEQILAQVPRNMKGQVEDILSGKSELPPISSDQAIKLRSLFLDLGRTMEDQLPSRAQGIFKQMANSTDGALQTGYGNYSPSGNMADKWRQANAGWREYVQDFGDSQSPLNMVLKQQDPAKIADAFLNRASVRDVQFLQKYTATDKTAGAALEAMKRQVITDIANNRFNVGREGLGGYPDSFLQTLFGPDDTKKLYTAAELGRRFKFELNPSGTSNVLLAASQMRNPKWAAAMPAAARMSMPRPAQSFIPRVIDIPSLSAAAALTGTGATLSPGAAGQQ